MKPWRAVGAVLIFLACVAAGAFGGCTAGLVAGLSLSTGPHGDPDKLFWIVLGLGVTAGVVLGVVLVRNILRRGSGPQPEDRP